MNDSQPVTALSERLSTLRHALHRHPEIGLDLPNSQRLIVEALADLPLELSFGAGLTSVTAVLRGGRPGPSVLLRGDMDALPVTESPSAFQSEIESAMHACGHDLHVAMLVGAAHLLAEQKDELAGDVILMFQPGEEGYDGAKIMIEEGVLEVSGSRPVAAYALHVTSGKFPHGVFAARPGSMMASADHLHVVVHGAGGHASAPHLALDPIPVACEIVVAIQTLVTRSLDVFDPAVVTVANINSGQLSSVIPAFATFEATIRSMSVETRQKLSASLPRLISNIAAAHGLTADVTLTPGYPVMVNDEQEVQFLSEAVKDLFGEESYAPMPNPLISSEDFSRVLAEIPGAYAMLGASPLGRDHATSAYNHSPDAVFDDGVLLRGATLLATLAGRRLSFAAEARHTSLNFQNTKE